MRMWLDLLVSHVVTTSYMGQNVKNCERGLGWGLGESTKRDYLFFFQVYPNLFSRDLLFSFLSLTRIVAVVVWLFGGILTQGLHPLGGHGEQ